MVALYQVKSNIVSSARINWIESLRTYISEWLQECEGCQVHLKNMFERYLETNDENYDGFDLDYKKLVESQSNITRLKHKMKLYVNSDEELHKKIEMKIDTIDSLLDVKINEDVHTSESSEKMQRYIEETIILFKEVFKKEWKKSKRIFKI